MKSILVPTDFSANSKSGIRFAILLASKPKHELVFIHVVNILRPTRWSDASFAKYMKEEEKLCKIKLEKFIAGIYKDMHAKSGKHSFVIIQGISADISILDYCKKNKNVDFICISTHGAGKYPKILGTNTGNLITKSKVPIIAVPKRYRATDIKNILYATDFQNYARELKMVFDFAAPFKAEIDVLHFSSPDEIPFDRTTIEMAFKKDYKYGLNVHFEEYDSKSLIESLQKQIRKRKPSLVVMFTDQERTFFQKLMVGSKAEELSFQLKSPLLVFGKS